MPASINNGDFVHSGQHRFDLTPAIPASSYGDREIDVTDPITCEKLDHQYVRTHGQAHGTAAVTERKVIHVARSVGQVVAVEAGHVVAGAGGATLTVDVRKNGTTILTAVISLTVAAAAYTRVSGTVDAAADDYVAGDVFEVVITATAGGGTLPQGVFLDVVFREGAG